MFWYLHKVVNEFYEDQIVISKHDNQIRPKQDNREHSSWILFPEEIMSRTKTFQGITLTFD